MNKLDNDKLISLVVYKLKDTLFNLMYDIVENPVDEIPNPPDKLNEFEEEIKALYTELGDVLDKSGEDKDKFNARIASLETKLVAAAIDINKFTCANNQLGEYILREMKLIEVGHIDESIPLNNSAIAGKVEHYLTHLKDDMESAFAKGELMASLPLRMTKAKYRDYIKNSFSAMASELPEEFAKSSMERLKDMGYADCMDKMKEELPLMAQTIEEIYNLPVSEFDKNNIEEYLNIIDDNINTLQNIYSCLDVMFNDTTYMKVLIDFVIDSDFIFEDDFVLKDLYYSICDSIRDNDTTMLETIADKLGTEIETRYEQSKSLEKEVADAVNSVENIDELNDDIKLTININNAVSNSYMRDIDNEIMMGMGVNNESKSVDELGDELCDYIESAVKEMPVPRQKYIKQRFLQHLPCTMTNSEITDYTNYSLSGINDRAVSLMACGDIFNITDKAEMEHHHNEHHHHHEHEHGEHCDCGHDHHHHN